MTPHDRFPIRSFSRQGLLLGALTLFTVGTSGALGCASTRTQVAAAPPDVCRARIARVWHGRTPNDKAEAYAAYLGEAIRKFRTLPGNLGYQMMRETVGDQTHFTVVSYWESRDAIHAYAGEDIRKTRHLPRDPEFLIELEPTVMNYDLAAMEVGCPR